MNSKFKIQNSKFRRGLPARTLLWLLPVATILAPGAATALDKQIAEIRVEGNKRVETDAVLSNIG